METVIKLYIRDDKNRPRGVALAVRDGENLLYGFSLLNTTLDRWDKKLGVAIALARASSPSYQLPSVLERESMVLDAFAKLQERALRYFKDMDPEKIRISKNLLGALEE